MAIPLLRALGFSDIKRAVETITPRRTFDDVVLPAETRRAISQALAEIGSHELLAAGGLYSRLYELQFRREEEAPRDVLTV